MENNKIINQWEVNRKKIKYSQLPSTVKGLKDYYIGDDIQKPMLKLTPDYQRLYKWERQQKTDLIESILLGIPLPPLFFSETIDGKYEIIDGLQRTCTVLEYIGVLDDSLIKKDQSIKEKLGKPKYLTEIENKSFNELPQEMRTRIYGYTFSISLLSSDSDQSAKHELFNRLNSGGTPLTKQEIRNTFFIQFKKEIYYKLMELRKIELFNDLISPSDKEVESESDTELILRLFALIDFKGDFKYTSETVAGFLDNEMKELINKNIDLGDYEKHFNQVFNILNITFSDDSLKRFDYNKNKFVGRMSIPGFDAIAGGIGFNLKNNNLDIDKLNIEELKIRIKGLWLSKAFMDSVGSKSGSFVELKLRNCIFIGRELFNLKTFFGKTEKEIAVKIDETLSVKFPKRNSK